MRTFRLLAVIYFYPRPPRGGRRSASGFGVRGQSISIHALREEGDSFLPGGLLHQPGFLSTPSARRATEQQTAMSYNSAISIHALREEGDLTDVLSMIVSMIFLSTPSARRATNLYRFIADFGVISIHALREEGD